VTLSRELFGKIWPHLAQGTPRNSWPEANFRTYVEAVYYAMNRTPLPIDVHRSTANLYVVELSPAVVPWAGLKLAGRDPDLPILYVGSTGLTPERRFERHKAGIQSGRGWVRDFGLQLLPRLYAHLNPIEGARKADIEADLAECLRSGGYGVIQA
jgi:hypothetical protein